MNLENLENKEPLIKDFFTWLFDDSRIVDKNIILEKEIDIVLAPHYEDANIYYPRQIAAFFDTKAMKRAGRISQLDLAIDEFSNVYHNRLEHSKGVYYRKLEEMLHNFQNPLWREKIEKNKMKLHLLAELIKMAGHDIGHLPLSHGLEIIIFSCRGIHEEIGKRIMLEEPEIQSVLKSISPDLPNILAELYEKPILNFKEHDESNNDVDRLDYLIRDNLYVGNPIHIPHSHYETVSVSLNDDGIPQTNPDGSIVISDNSNFTIDVYDYSSLSNIEYFLETREAGYKNIYFLPKTTIKEKTILAFFDTFLQSDSQSGKDLKNYVNTLSSSNISSLDLSLFLDWDDITFYSQILDIAENHENINVRNLATMTLPNMTAFLNMLYSHLNLNAKTQNYSEEDRNFLYKVKTIIKGNNSFSNNLRDPNFFADNTLIFDTNSTLPDNYKTYIDNGLIYSTSLKIRTYNPESPIYIKDEDEKIYELSAYPKRKCDWDSKISYIKSMFSYAPFLRLKGVSDKEINEMRKFCYLSPSQTPKKQNYSVNMQPLQVGHNIEDSFLEI